ncbi:MAG: cation:proton antiporter [Syntrophomonadaceae bacterium]|nr:cation:proton antiporter [Syntrophomonadaceae bacterium]
MENGILQDIIIIAGLAVVVLYVFNRIGIPAIVGFLLTGIIAGPHGLALIKSPEQVQSIAELGVILLLFSIGLEFSFKSLINIGKTVLLGGTLQVGLTIAATFGIAFAFGLPANQALFLGFLVSLSSTAIVLKQLGERAEMDSPHGKIILGILIFQDIIVVAMMLFAPLLGSTEAQIDPIGIMLLKAVAVVVLIIILSLYVVPPLLDKITRTQSRELFLISIIVICFAVAELTYSIGLSLALGAFLAGLSISESEYSHQALANVTPFLDTFTSIFFVSIGMLLNLQVVLSNLALIILITLSVIVIKVLICVITTLILKYPLRTSVLVGLSLAQVGEFAFILSQAGIEYNIISTELYQGFLAASILTMMLTPFLISGSNRIAGLVLKFSSGHVKSAEDFEETDFVLNNHLIIIGYGINGKNLARAAAYANIPYIILDLNSETVRKERLVGQPILYGDAVNELVLKNAEIDTARVVVIAISDPVATRRIITTIRRINPAIHIIVRTRFVADVTDLHKLGANEVIPEEYETSIEIFARVLSRYMVPIDDIEKHIDMVRSEDYEMFRSLYRIEPEGAFSFSDIDIWSVRVGQQSYITGRNLAEIDMRNRMGITILAIQRNNDTFYNPGADAIIQPGDQLIMMGKAEQIRSAAKQIG